MSSPELISVPLNDSIDIVLDRLRQAVSSSTQFHEDLVSAVGLYLARQPASGSIEEALGELQELIGAKWQDELTALVKDFAQNRAVYSPDGPQDGRDRRADPVDTASGQFTYSNTDLTVNGAGLHLSFTRTYKNRAYISGPFGANWDHSANLWLREEGQDLVRSSGELREDRYRLHELHGYWVPPPGFHDIIVPDGESFRAISPYGTIHRYEREDGRRHRLRHVEDRNHNRIVFRYDQHGRLNFITVNSDDRWVAFEYDQLDRIFRLRTHAISYKSSTNSESKSEREWYYEYDDFNDLVAVTEPGGLEYPSGLKTRYDYTSSSYTGDLAHNLMSVYSADGNLVVQNEYGTERGTFGYNRVARQLEGGGEHAFDYAELAKQTDDSTPIEDVPASRTTHRMPNGHVVDRYHNRAGNLLAVVERLTYGCETLTLVYEYRYNADGARIASVSPEGRVKQSVYGRDVYRERHPSAPEEWRDPALNASVRPGFGNLIATISRTTFTEMRQQYTLFAPLSNPFHTETDDVIQKYSYETVANQLVSASDPRFTQSADPAHPESGEYSRHLTVMEHSPTSEVLPTRLRYPATTYPAKLGNITGAVSGTIKYISYDPNGRLLRKRDECGQVSEKRYYAEGVRAGYLRETTADVGGLALTTSYDVDEAGRIIATTDPRGSTTRRILDDRGLLTAVIPPIGAATTFNYDAANRVVQERTGQPGRTNPFMERLFAYDGQGRLIEEYVMGQGLPTPRLTNHRYDASDQLVETVTPRKTLVRFQYDERLMLRNVTRGAGTVDASEVSYSYDRDGFQTVATDARGYETVTRRDALGRIIEIIDPLGGCRLKSYDKGDRALAEVFLAPTLSAEFEVLSAREWSYDERGTLIVSTLWVFDGPVPVSKKPDVRDALTAVKNAGATPSTTMYFHDAARRQIVVRDPLGNESTTEYDNLSRSIRSVDAVGASTERQYDQNGNVIRVDRYDPGGATSEVFSECNEYDRLNRRTASTDGLGNRTSYSYDEIGHLAETADSLGRITRRENDCLGRVLSTSRIADKAVLSTTVMTYDENGNLATVTSPGGDCTAYKYDTLDRRTKLIYPDGTASATRYYADGKVESTTDGDGRNLNFIVDALGRVTAVRFDTGESAEYRLVESNTFDALGRAVAQCNDVADIEICYDSLGRPIVETVRYHGSGAPIRPLRIRRTYDKRSSRKSMELPGGRTQLEERDGVGRVTYIRQGDLGEHTGSRLIRVGDVISSYLHHGPRLVRVGLGNGLSRHYGYDAGGRAVEVTVASSIKRLALLQYAFDGVHRRALSRVEPPHNSNRPNGSILSHDELDQLTGERLKTLSDLTVATARPASIPIPVEELNGQAAIDVVIASSSGGAMALSVQYDAAGNRLLLDGQGNHPVRYEPTVGGRYSTVDAQPWSYYMNGCLRSDGTFMYQYDHRNSLILITSPRSGANVLIERDPLGRPVRIETATETRFLLYDGQHVVEEYVNGKLDTQYVLCGSERVLMARRGENWWPHHDIVGSAWLMTNDVGDVVSRYEIGPFGVAQSPATFDYFYVFAGFRRLPGLLIDDAVTRSYAPASGRYLQRDPAGMQDGSHSYSYCGNDPISHVDPLGQERTQAVTFDPEIISGRMSLEDRFVVVSQMYDEDLNGTTGEARRRVHAHYEDELRALRHEAIGAGQVQMGKFALGTYAIGLTGGAGGWLAGVWAGAVAGLLELGTVGTALVTGAATGVGSAAAEELMNVALGKPRFDPSVLLWGLGAGIAGSAASTAYHYYSFPVKSTFVAGKPGVIGAGRYGWQFQVENVTGSISRPSTPRLEPDIPVEPGLHRAHYHGWFIGGGNKAFYSNPRINMSYIRVAENAALRDAYGGNIEVSTLRGGGRTALNWSAYTPQGESIHLGIGNVRASGAPRVAPLLKASGQSMSSGSTLWLEE